MEEEEIRKEFETWLLDSYNCNYYSKFRSDETGHYLNDVSHRTKAGKYASVQMLWEAWIASSRKR